MNDGEQYKRAIREFSDEVTKILKERSRGEVDTWGFVAAFLDMLSEASQRLLSSKDGSAPALDSPQSPSSPVPKGLWTVEEVPGGHYLCYGGRKLLHAIHDNNLGQLQEIAYLANTTLHVSSDTERLDWLEKSWADVEQNCVTGVRYVVGIDTLWAGSGEGKDLREAIDAAMGKQEANVSAGKTENLGEKDA